MNNQLLCVVECEDLEQRSRLTMFMHDCRINYALGGRVVFFNELPYNDSIDLFAETLATAAKQSGAKIIVAARMHFPCMYEDHRGLEHQLETEISKGFASRIKFPLSALSMIDRAPLPDGVTLSVK